MDTSILELFKIGIGPSSSYTVGPCAPPDRLPRVSITRSSLGLRGEQPDQVDPARIEGLVRGVRESKSILSWAANGTRFMKPATCSWRRHRATGPPERHALTAFDCGSVNTARMAMTEEGGHKVTLDQMIRTMCQTGLDIRSHYKETSLGGLAVNVSDS